MDCNEYLSTSIENRLEDLHNAFADPSIQGILPVCGGQGAIQLVDGIDYDLISRSTKILCGYSDIGNICNAILAKTGMVTYYGPNFSGFMMKQGFEYSLEYFKKCLFEEESYSISPSKSWNDDDWSKNQHNRTFSPNEGYWAITEGQAEGIIIGGNIFALNRLQGTEYMPNLKNSIIFCEFPGQGKPTLLHIDNCLRTLLSIPHSLHIYNWRV